MHRAPVVGIVILDGHGVPLPEPLEVAHDLARSPDMHGLHHLLVISEEQFKVTDSLSFTPTKEVHLYANKKTESLCWFHYMKCTRCLYVTTIGLQKPECNITNTHG